MRSTKTHDFSTSFSSLASTYAQIRPTYPDELFSGLAAGLESHKLAWDVGTGSGQAAIKLAAHFDHVVATDFSREQLAHARLHPKIEYREAEAHLSGLSDHSVELITAACSIHWFNLDLFYEEVRRVLKPGGKLAAWTYFIPYVDDQSNEAITRYYMELVSPLLPTHQSYYTSYYQDLPFPFAQEAPPCKEMVVNWNLDQLKQMMGSYSTRSKFIELNGADPLDLIGPELDRAWGDPTSIKPVHFPLGFKLGRVD